MRLKKLTISGFKSFPERTVLNFEEGVTAIVGPNGCGKSNIADSIRWVLGEQSAKSLRSGKMQDVIFSGSAKRKPVNIAEVSITLSDVHQALPTEYDELCITRRLHRNGESEYFLNRQPVRLKDIHSLLLDSGMGREAFSIFEQGQMDQVINLSPYDRRALFEEAAGILRVKVRKKETLDRLEKVDLNLSRLKDIYHEVDTLTVQLEKQALSARTFKSQQERLEYLERATLLHKWRQNFKRHQENETKQAALLNEQQNASSKLQALSARQQELQQALEAASQAEEEQRKEVFNQHRLKDVKAVELRAQEQQKRQLEKRLEQLQMALQTLQKKKDAELQEKERAAQELETLQRSTDKEEKALEQLRQRVSQAQQALEELRLQLSQLHQEQLQAVQQEGHLLRELQQRQTQQRVKEEQRSTLEKTGQKLQRRKAELEESITGLKKELANHTQTSEKQKNELKRIAKQLQETEQLLEVRQKVYQQVSQDYLTLSTREKMLIQLRDEREGVSQGSQQLLKAAASPKSPLHGLLKPLYDCFTPSAKYATALANVLHAYAGTLVVETENQAEAVLAFAKKEKIRDFSLICLEWLSKKKSKNKTALSHQFADDLLAEHFLSHVLLCENIEKAIKAEATAYVTEKGEFFDLQQVLFFPSETKQNVFVRAAELQEIQAQAKLAKEQQLETEKSIQHLTQEQARLQVERTELDRTLRKGEIKLVETNFALQRALSDQQTLHHEIETQTAQLQALEKESRSFTPQLEEDTHKHLEAKKAADRLKNSCAQLQAEVQQRSTLVNSLMQEQKNGEQTLRMVVQRLQQLQQIVSVWDTKEQAFFADQQRLREETAALESQKEETQTVLQRLAVQLETETQTAITAEAKHQQIQALLMQSRRDLHELEKQAESGRKGAKSFEERKHQLEIAAAQLQNTHQMLVQELFERFGLTENALATTEAPLDIPAEEAEKELRQLRKAVENAQDINLSAIEEHTRQLERRDQLKIQVTDLETSRQDLLAITKQLETESRHLFKKSFEAIRANFRKNFALLFEGGEADLKLTDSPDILEAGIEITAKPPGKQMRAITLLSGGEKCLTALALLFAIFEVKPSPFCILDEVDAPLDDTNVKRFTNVLNQFLTTTQFVIITHNKQTMAVANVLFGISMQERGVSSIVPLFLEAAHPSRELATR